MKVLLFGHRGNMGRRYAAILDQLGIAYDGIELSRPEINAQGIYDRIIIATPTDTHIKIIKNCLALFPKTKILCEKPISKNLDELLELKANWDVSKIFMVNNYAYMLHMNPNKIENDDTNYDYFKTGGDGIFWDCIQLFHLAKSRITLKANSPKWDVQINGLQLNASMIDQSYIEMLADFCGNMQHCWNFTDVLKTHEIVEKEMQCLK